MALDPHGLHRPDGEPLRTYEEARADYLRKLAAPLVLLAAIRSRGEDQVLALAELRRRGLGLTPEERVRAGLPREPSDFIP